MTKYVLNSGGLGKHPELKKKFHLELVKDLGENPHFLICSFAQPREEWEGRFQGYSDAIAEDMPQNKKPSFTLAMPDEFVEQCKKADVIYFNGGDDHLVQYWMKQYNLAELFTDKVVATNSASSNMLSTHYWTCDWRQCADGLGVLPTKFIPHYLSDFGDDDPRGPIDWEKAYKDLADYGDTSLPIHALEEGDYVVFEV
jgi:hypothetical protein